MKVYIGKYSDYIGPYQIADSFKKIGISKETCDKMGDWLASTWINDFLQWIDSKKKRKIKVHIDNYDLWNMDSTLVWGFSQVNSDWEEKYYYQDKQFDKEIFDKHQKRMDNSFRLFGKYYQALWT